MAGYAPFLRSVTVGTSAVQLSALIAAIEPNFPTRLGVLNLQSSPGNTAAGHIYVGNAAVTANNNGADLQPNGSVNIPQNDVNVILSTDVWLLATSASQQLNVMAIPIGQ